MSATALIADSFPSVGSDSNRKMATACGVAHLDGDNPATRNGPVVTHNHTIGGGTGTDTHAR